MHLFVAVLFWRNICFLGGRSWLPGLAEQGIRIFYRENLNFYLVDRQANPDIANDKFLDIEKIVEIDCRHVVDRQTLALVNTVLEQPADV